MWPTALCRRNTADNLISDEETNKPEFFGGGIYNDAGSTLNVAASTLTANTASGLSGRGWDIEGGGTFNVGTATLTDSTLAANSTTGGAGPLGGGLLNAGNLTVIHTTLVGNAADVGGGIYNRGSALVVATIVADSGSGGDCAGATAPPVRDGEYNLDDDGSCRFTALDHSLSHVPAGLDGAVPKGNGGPTTDCRPKAGEPSHRRRDLAVGL